MCGRAYRTTPSGNLAKHFEAELSAAGEADLGSNYNMGPSSKIAAVREPKDGVRELTSLYWGLVPSWAKDDGKRRPSLHNAKSETAHEKPSFRAAFKRRRCLIVFDGFYEWLREDKKNKRPFLFRRPDGAPIAMAGLWEYNAAFELESGAVLTTDSNELLSQIHTRMPVILPDEASQRLWLAEGEDTAALRELMKPCDSELLEMFEVGKEVNSTKNNSAALLASLDAEGREV